MLNIPRKTKTKNLDYYKIAIALISSKNQKEAYKKLGITQKTMQNYLSDKEFIKVLEKLQRESITTATIKINNSLTLAIDTLINVLEDKKATISDKIRASNSLIEHALSVQELSLRRGANLTGQSEILLSIAEVIREKTTEEQEEL